MRTSSSHNNTINIATNTNTIFDISRFCTAKVPDFTPLGGSRPDAAVVGCVTMCMEEEEEAKNNVIFPPDVLDTALAMLCAPLAVKHVKELQGWEAYFMFPTATVRLRTTDEDVEGALRGMTPKMPNGALTVKVVLEDSVT